jgi:hypothetical protein
LQQKKDKGQHGGNARREDMVKLVAAAVVVSLVSNYLLFAGVAWLQAALGLLSWEEGGAEVSYHEESITATAIGMLTSIVRVDLAFLLPNQPMVKNQSYHQSLNTAYAAYCIKNVNNGIFAQNCVSAKERHSEKRDITRASR